MGNENNPLVLHTRVVCGTGGGPEKTILNSARYLVPCGYDVLCAYMHPPGDPGFEELRRRAESLGSPMVGIEDRGPWDLRVARRLLDLCRTRRVAIWHGHDYKSNALGLLLRRSWPMKLVTTVHGWVSYSLRSRFYYRIDRFAIRRYDRVICVSDDIQRTCLECGVAADRSVMIENAIDCAQWQRRLATAEAKQRLGLDPRRMAIGSAGRLTAEKDFEGLVRAVARLVSDGVDAELVLVGEGDRRPALEALAAELGLGDRVRLLGYRADMPEVYQALDVFALNSLREGLPNVLLEALALEVPVVATRVAGIPRLIEHEANGLLVGPEADDELAAAIRRLLGDGELRRRLAAAGRRTVEERYSFEVRMAKVRAIYDDLLGP